MKQRFHSAEISCEHCRKSIESALQANGQVQSCQVDIENRIITVESDLETKALLDLIDEAGYPASPVSGD